MSRRNALILSFTMLTVGIAVGCGVTVLFLASQKNDKGPLEPANPPATTNDAKTTPSDRRRQQLFDLVIEAGGPEGFADAEEKMGRIRQDRFLNDRIETMVPLLEAAAMVQYVRPQDGQRITRSVRLVGIDVRTKDQSGEFKKHLVHGKTLPQTTFDLPDDLRKDVAERLRIIEEKNRAEVLKLLRQDVRPDEPPPPTPPRSADVAVPPGAFVGYLLAGFRYVDPVSNKLVESFVLQPGSDVTFIMMRGDGLGLEPVVWRFVVADYFKSDIVEIDNNCVFVPLATLQEIRRMPKRATSIPIRLKEGCDDKTGQQVKEALETLFVRDGVMVNSWEARVTLRAVR